MKRIIVISMVVLFAGFLCGVATEAQALDVNAIFGQLKSELLQKGMVASDIKSLEPPVKNMLSLGGNPTDIKGILLDLMSKGFKGKDFSSLVGMISDLAKNGEPVKNAAGVVSSAIQGASLLGLKGADLIAKVQNIVNQKKTQLSQARGNTTAAAGEQVKKADDFKKGLTSVFGKLQ